MKKTKHDGSYVMTYSHGQYYILCFEEKTNRNW